MKKIALEYVNELKDSNHCFFSWEHCYNASRNFDNTDHLALQLAGECIRGSTTLHKKDYKVYYGVVQLIKPISKEHKLIKNQCHFQIGRQYFFNFRNSHINRFFQDFISLFL